MAKYPNPCNDIPEIKSHHPIAYYLNNDTSGILSCPWATTRTAVRISTSVGAVGAAIAAFIVCHIKHTRWAYLTSAIIMGFAIGMGYVSSKDISAYMKADSFCRKGMPKVPFATSHHTVQCKMTVFVASVILDVFTAAFLLAAGCLTVVFICKAGKSFYDAGSKNKSKSTEDGETEGGNDDLSVNSSDEPKKKSRFSFFGRKKAKKLEDGDTDFEAESEKKAILGEGQKEDESSGVDFEKEGKKRFSPFTQKDQKRSTARSLFGSSEPAAPSESPSSTDSLTGNDLFNFDAVEAEKKETPKPEPKPQPQPQPKVESKPAPSATDSTDDFFDFESVPESKKK